MGFYKSIIFLLLIITSKVNSQSIYVPANIQQSVEKKSRTNYGIPGNNYFQNHSNYRINASLNTKSGELTGRANITYFNDSRDTLDKIVMRLYQNIFRSDAARDETVAEENQSTGILITDLYIDGVSLTNVMSQYTRTEVTNLYVYLKNTLSPGDSCHLNVAWRFTMPRTSVHRFGKYSENTYFVAMWYPQIAVYDDIDGWDEMQYNGTQEYYNDFSNYDVSIQVPRGNVVWATGECVNYSDILTDRINDRIKKAKENDEVVHIIDQTDIEDNTIFKGLKRSFHFIARNVPDFAFATSDHYLWDATTALLDSASNKKVFVSAVYPKETSDFYQVASIGSEIVRRISKESYGINFPYPFVTIFNGEGGMEFPMMVNNRSSSNFNSCVFLTLHEISHAYFPFMTGINERKYSWVDEGLTSYLPMETQDSMDSDYNSLSYFVARYEAFCGEDLDVPLMVPAYQIKEYSYVFYSYYRSAVAFNMLENLMGRDTFRLAVRKFIETWQGKHPTSYDLLNVIKLSTSKDIEWLINQWFFGTGYPDLAIEEVKISEDSLLIQIKNKGNFAVPIELTLTYVNGETEVIHRNIEIWKDKNTIIICRPIKPDLKKIELGNKLIPDKSRKDNIYMLQ